MPPFTLATFPRNNFSQVYKLYLPSKRAADSLHLSLPQHASPWKAKKQAKRREQAPALTSFKHDFELAPQRESTVIIDYRNSGIGSNSCGPTLNEKYRISEKEFDFEFSVKPEVIGNKLPEVEYSALTKL